MPRFFFHLRNANRALADCEGITVANAEAAHCQALATLRDFVQPSTGCVPPEWDGWLMQIADERGRCLFSIPFAQAAELAERELPSQPEEPGSRRVVYLDIERARREFASVENEGRRHIRRTVMLVERARSETKILQEMLRATDEERKRSQELLTRSRSQSSAIDWCWTYATAR